MLNSSPVARAVVVRPSGNGPDVSGTNAGTCCGSSWETSRAPFARAVGLGLGRAGVRSASCCPSIAASTYRSSSSYHALLSRWGPHRNYAIPSLQIKSGLTQLRSRDQHSVHRLVDAEIFELQVCHIQSLTCMPDMYTPRF